MSARFASRAFLFCLVVLAISLLIQAAYRGVNGYGWGDDWAQYLLHARALAEGRTYGDIGYVFSPSSAFIGPPAYPPGTAFLLAPVFGIFGYSLLAGELVMVVCILTFVWAFFLFAREASTPELAMVTALVVAVHPQVWWLGSEILSEPPFLAFTYLGLAVGLWRDQSQNRRVLFLCSLILGGLLYCGYAIRQAGVVLFLAFVFVDLFQTRYRLVRLVPMVGIFVLGCVLQASWMPDASSYNAIVVHNIGTKIGDNLYSAINNLRHFGYLGGRLDIGPTLILMLLAGTGLWPLWRKILMAIKSPETPWTKRFISIAQVIPVHVFYLMGTIMLIALLPFSQGPRYLLPIIPILFLYAVQGAWLLFERTLSTRKFAFAGVVVLILMTGFAYYIEGGARTFQQGPYSRTAQDLFSVVRNVVPEDGLVVFSKPRAMALLADRRSISWPFGDGSTSPAIFVSRERPSHAVLPSVPQLPKPPQAFRDYLADPKNADLVYSNPDFALYVLSGVHGTP